MHMGFFSINKIKAFEQIVGSDFFSIKVVNLLGNRPVQVFQIRFKITASEAECRENFSECFAKLPDRL